MGLKRINERVVCMWSAHASSEKSQISASCFNSERNNITFPIYITNKNNRRSLSALVYRVDNYRKIHKIFRR